MYVYAHRVHTSHSTCTATESRALHPCRHGQPRASLPTTTTARFPTAVCVRRGNRRRDAPNRPRIGPQDFWGVVFAFFSDGTMSTMMSSATPEQLAAEVERLKAHLDNVRGTKSDDAVTQFAQYVSQAREPYHATHDEINPWNSQTGDKPCCVLQ